MAKPAYDADALIQMFETATAKQGEQVRQAVGKATLTALQGRELTLKNIRAALKSVSEAASVGAARNTVPDLDPQQLLDQAVAGMDDALVKAVEANRVALSTLATQGADLRERHLSQALAELDKLEDALFATLKKTAAGADEAVGAAWGQVLSKLQAGGTLSGAKAALTVEQMAEQMHTALRSSRAASVRAAQAMAESYTAMVSGVLLGLSEALQATTVPKKGRK